MSQTETASDLDTLTAGWVALFRDQRDIFEVVSALFQQTDAGARPALIAPLAKHLGREVDELRALVDRANAGLPALTTWHTEDAVWLDLASDQPRFDYQIGDRRIGVAGCAPDIFWTAQEIDQPMSVEATCPVTGTPITVHFTPEGVSDVHPPDTVVAVVDLTTTPEAATLADAARVDADVCTQQTFFANADAAQPWLEKHPGGRVIAVAEFDRWIRDLRAQANT